ncbi:GAF domain-containing protein [Streptomyces flavidovirens]|uniref:GAF domain-containing protein n=1 Tax=Streptomyces flavidovirens TaxID=67298 RepID=UPI00369819BF
MARDLLAQESVQQTLDRIGVHAVNLVDGCEDACILTIDRGEVATLSATSDLVRDSDRLQGEVGQGPCYDATRHHERVYRIRDTEHESRWPLYVPEARKLGIGSMLGFLLYTADDNLGALNLYSHTRAPSPTGPSRSAGSSPPTPQSPSPARAPTHS